MYPHWLPENISLLGGNDSDYLLLTNLILQAFGEENFKNDVYNDVTCSCVTVVAIMMLNEWFLYWDPRMHRAWTSLPSLAIFQEMTRKFINWSVKTSSGNITALSLGSLDTPTCKSITYLVDGGQCFRGRLTAMKPSNLMTIFHWIKENYLHSHTDDYACLYLPRSSDLMWRRRLLFLLVWYGQ